MSIKKYCLFLFCIAVAMATSEQVCDPSYCSSGCCTAQNTCTSSLASDCVNKVATAIDCATSNAPDNTKCPVPYSCQKSTLKCVLTTTLVQKTQDVYNKCTVASECYNAQYSAAQCKLYCASSEGQLVTNCMANCRMNYACQKNFWTNGNDKICQKCDGSLCANNGCCDTYDNTCLASSASQCSTGIVSCTTNSDCTSSSALTNPSQYECTTGQCTLQCQYDPVCQSIVDVGTAATSFLTYLLWGFVIFVCATVIIIVICCVCCCKAVADASEVHVRRVGNGQQFQQQSNVQMQSMTVEQDQTLTSINIQ